MERSLEERGKNKTQGRCLRKCVSLRSRAKQGAGKELQEEHLFSNPTRKSEQIGSGLNSGSQVGTHQCDLVQKLSMKLRMVEEDNRIMKKALLRYMEERTLLMKEVTQKFQNIRECRIKSESEAGLLLDPSSRSLKCLNCNKTPNSKTMQDRRKAIGLSELLQQYSTPLLVFGDTKINCNAPLKSNEDL